MADDEVKINVKLNAMVDEFLDQVGKAKSQAEQKLNSIPASLKLNGNATSNFNNSSSAFRSDLSDLSGILSGYKGKVNSGNFSTFDSHLTLMFSKMHDDLTKMQNEMVGARTKGGGRISARRAEDVFSDVHSSLLQNEDTLNYIGNTNARMKKQAAQEAEDKSVKKAEQDAAKSTAQKAKTTGVVAGIVGTAIAGIGKALGGLVQVAGKGVGAIGKLTTMITSAVSGTIQTATNMAGSFLQSGGNLVSQIPIIGNILSIPFSAGHAGVSALGSISSGLIGGFGKGVGGVFGGLGSAVGSAGSGIATLGKGVGGGIAAGAAAGSFIPVIGTAAGAIIGGITGLLGGGIGGATKLAGGVLNGATSIAGGAINGAMGILDGLTKAVLQAPILIEDTTKKLIRTMLGLTAAVAGIAKFVQKDTTNRIENSNSTNGYFDADPKMALSETYHRRMEQWKAYERYMGKAAPFHTSNIISAATNIQKNIQDTMTGQQFSDRFAIDGNWILQRLGLGSKYNLAEMLSSNDFDSIGFVTDVMRSIEANPYALLNDTILREAVENIIGDQNVNDAVARFLQNRTTGNKVSMFDEYKEIGRGRGTTAVTQNMKRFQESLARLSGAFDEAKQNIASGLLPVMDSLVKKVTDVIDIISGKLNNFFLEKNGRTVIDEIQDVFKNVFGSAKEFKTELAETLGYIAEFFKMLMESIGESVIAIINGIKEAWNGDIKNFDEYKKKAYVGNVLGRDVYRNLWWWERLQVRGEHALNTAGNSVQNTKDKISDSWSNMASKIKENGFIDKFIDFTGKMKDDLWYGDLNADDDDKIVRTKLGAGSPMQDKMIQQKSQSLRNSGIWGQYYAGLIYSNEAGYKALSDALLERMVRDALEKTGIESAKLFGEGERLDANEFAGSSNPEKYMELVQKWAEESLSPKEMSDFLKNLFDMTNSAFVRYNEGDRTSVKLSGRRSGNQTYTLNISFGGGDNVNVTTDLKGDSRSN